jgi:hypothetical protein
MKEKIMPTKQVKESKSEDTSVERVKTTPPWPFITVGVFASVVVAALFVTGGLIMAGHHRDHHVDGFGPFGAKERMSRMSSHHEAFGGRMHMTPAVHGVVTAISGDILTVSGGGTQVNVERSSDTDIKGDKTDVAVNDTVIIYGTKDGDTVSATKILVRNQDLKDRMMERRG